MSDYIRYGDSIAFQNGYDSWSGWFLSIIPHADTAGGAPAAPRLWTEVAPPKKNLPNDYLWTIIPAHGSSKKTGDIVSTGDNLLLVAHDSAGNERYLSINETDQKSVMATKRPSDFDYATWQIEGVPKLNGWQADGMPVKNIEYGKADYITFLNPAFSRALCVTQDPNQPGPFKHMLVTVPFKSESEIAAAGLTQWWHAWHNTQEYKNGGDNNGNGHHHDHGHHDHGPHHHGHHDHGHHDHGHHDHGHHHHDGGNGGDCHNMQVGAVEIGSPGAPTTKGGDMDGFTQVNFPKPFPDGSKVVVVPMTQTFNGPDTPGLRIAHVTTTGFKIRINELVSHGGHKPLSDGNHGKETIGWAAFTVDK